MSIFILQIKSDAEEELNESVSHLVREWAENTMPGTKFGSLQELAAHLIDKMYVDTRSKSAYSVIAAIQKKTIRPPEASGTYLKKLKILIQLIGNRKHISSFLPSA